MQNYIKNEEEEKNIIANKFINDLWNIDGWPAFIIGEIREKTRINNNNNNDNQLCVFANQND